MGKLIYLLALLLVTSCNEVGHKAHDSLERSLVTNVARRFSKDFITFRKKGQITVVVTNLPNHIHGVCESSRKTIFLNTTYLVRDNLSAMEAVLFRELVRCNLDLPYSMGIMSKFVGHTVTAYLYDYEDSVKYIKEQLR